MNIQLTQRSIFAHWQTPFLLLIYIGIRVISFGIAADPLIHSTISILILSTFALLCFKDTSWGWRFLLGELFLGGNGHFLELQGISIRTFLIIIFMFIWCLKSLDERSFKKYFLIPNKLFHLLILMSFCLFAAAAVGLAYGHPLGLILQGMVPYAYFILLLPAYQLFQDDTNQSFLARLILVFILGSALFSLFTFVLYSSHLGLLQDTYYHWFRDIAGGKITDLGNNFFRIVLPEHLLITPIILLISSLLMRDERHHKLWRFFLFAALFVFMLNFSRIYFIALAVGLLVLKYKHSFKRWLIVSATVTGLIFITLTILYFPASRGLSLGWELLGIRLSSIVQPATDVSASLRMALLPNIVDIIVQHPILGTGLGANVNFINPLTNIQTTTSQFDWGYLQMWVELGLYGLALYLAIIFTGISELIKKIHETPDWHDFYVGLLAGIVAFLVMNITSPALFHVFGVVFLSLVFTVAMKPVAIFEQLVNLLYRVFNRLKS